MAILNCFKNSVGLTNINCVCDDAGRPVDYNVSYSGLYISQLLPMQFAKAASSCNYGDMWQMSCDSLQQAEILVNQEIKMIVDGNTKKVIAPYKGIVGDITRLEVSDYNVTKQYLYEKLFFRTLRKGTLTIKRIGLHLNAAINTNIVLHDCNGTPIASYPIITVANKVEWITLPVPYVVDMSDINKRCLFISYDRMGAKPKTDKYHCGCGGKNYKYNESAPQWNDKNAFEWGKFMIAGSGATDDINNFDNEACNGTYNNGIFLDIETDCEYSMCSDVEADYKNKPFYFSVAYMIHRKAAVIQIEKIQLSNSISTYLNDLPQETINTMIEKFTMEYNDAKKYVTEYMLTNMSQFTDCYHCYNPTGFRTRNMAV